MIKLKRKVREKDYSVQESSGANIKKYKFCKRTKSGTII